MISDHVAKVLVEILETRGDRWRQKNHLSNVRIVVSIFCGALCLPLEQFILA